MEVNVVAWFRRGRAGKGAGGQVDRSQRKADIEEVRSHFENFVATRKGVEAYIEPATNVTPTTLLLIATDGEWTRRRIADANLVHDLADRHSVPVYNVQFTGYPQRMRDWTAKVRREGPSV